MIWTLSADPAAGVMSLGMLSSVEERALHHNRALAPKIASQPMHGMGIEVRAR
jgi:hypothetical protein